MKKDFNETTANQLREFYAHYFQLQKDKDELSGLIKEKPDSVKLLSEVPPWSLFYELPYRSFLAICIIEFNLTETIQKVAQSDDQFQSFLNFMEDLENESIDDEELTDEEKGFRFSLVMALTNQLSSMATHSQPLSILIEKVRKGDDEALFDAVLVDRSIVSAPSITNRIQVAQLTEDENFMELLSKAIKRSRPRRPDVKLDDLRYMIEVLDEEIGLSNITHDKIYDILAEDLELYDASTDGLKDLIKRRNKKHRR